MIALRHIANTLYLPAVKPMVLLLSFCLLSFTLVAVKLPAVALAQDQKTGIPGMEFTPIGIDTTFDTTKVLRLESLLSIVDKNFPRLLAADAERRMSSARRLETQGAFDPTVTSVNEYLRVQDIVNAGVGKNAVHNEPQLGALTRSGVRLYGRVRYNPNDAKTPFLPTGKSGEYSAGGTVPLAQGLGINPARAAEMQAKIGEPLADENFKTTRLGMLFDAASAYWDWVASAKKIAIAQDLLNIAQSREQFVDQGSSRGDLPRIDLAEAQQEVQRRRGDIYKAQRDFQKSTFRLGIFVWDPQAVDRSPLPSMTNVPEEIPQPRDPNLIVSTEAINLALARRPEIKALKYQQDIAQVELKLAKNMLLPVVNANFYEGADTGRQGIGFVTKGSVDFALPLYLRNARGKVQAAKLKLQKINYEQGLLRQRIELEVMDALSNISALHERFLAAEQEVEQSRILEKGEREKYRFGDSTLFVVNRRERDRAEAEIKLIDVQTEYWRAQAALRAVTAQL